MGFGCCLFFLPLYHLFYFVLFYSVSLHILIEIYRLGNGFAFILTNSGTVSILRPANLLPWQQID